MKYTLFVLFFALSFMSYAQGELPPPPPPKPPHYEKIKDDYCVPNNKYDDKQLLQLFPFNKVSLVKLVSIKEGTSKTVLTGMRDGIKLDTTSWKETVVLPQSQYNELSRIMFGFSAFKNFDSTTTWEESCYEPTHAVVFYNRNYQIIAVTEISFKCNKIKTYPSSFGGQKKCSTILGYYRRFFSNEMIVPNYTSN